MMLIDQKNSVTPIFLIIFLLIVNLLSGCSGCSKSGRRIPENNSKIELINSENDHQNKSETSGRVID